MNRFTFAQYPGLRAAEGQCGQTSTGLLRQSRGGSQVPDLDPPRPPFVRVPRCAGSARLSAGLQSRHGGTLHPRFLRGRADKVALQRQAGPRLFRPVRGQRLRQRIFAVRGSAAAERRVRPDDRVDERGPCRAQNVLRLLLWGAQRTRGGHLGRTVPDQPRQLLGSRTEMGSLRRQLGEPGQDESRNRLPRPQRSDLVDQPGSHPAGDRM